MSLLLLKLFKDFERVINDLLLITFFLVIRGAQEFHHEWIVAPRLFKHLLLLELLKMLIQLRAQEILLLVPLVDRSVLRVEVILTRIIPQEDIVLLVNLACIGKESLRVIVCPKDQRVLLLFSCLVEKLVFKGILVIKVRVQEGLR